MRLPRAARRLLSRNVTAPRVELEELADGVTHVRMTSRLLRRHGMVSSAYVLDDLLVDSGFAYMRGPLVRALAEGAPLAAIALTHHHEDHTGNCGVLSEVHGCPIYLREVDARFGEGVESLEPYRVLYWGQPGSYEPMEMPEVVETSKRRLRPVPTPGHSATHTAFFEEATGVVWTGDLLVSTGASAVMTHENPYEVVASLRRVAALDPARMLTGHGMALEAPAPRLRKKADRIAEAATKVLDLHGAGVPLAEIRRRVFRRGAAQDSVVATFTRGEFSRSNFVHACIEHGCDAELLRP